MSAPLTARDFANDLLGAVAAAQRQAPREHAPALPPSHPNFQRVLRHLATAPSTEEAITFCRNQLAVYRAVRDEEDCDWLIRKGYTAMDLPGFIAFLERRIRELQGAR